VLSLGGGIYCCSASEVVECSVSARQAAPCFSVPLKEGMRPAPVAVEVETEPAEAGKEEKQAEKAEETPVTDEAKAAQEELGYVWVLFVLLLQLFACGNH